MANDKQIVRKLTLKDANNVNVVYDIGALGENIKYDDNISINEKIDSVATDVSIISGEITPATQHISKSVTDENGIHDLRYHEKKLQYYNGSEWKDVISPGVYETWQDATEAEIASMIQKHYNEQLDLSEIWSIGDTRTMTLESGISATGTYNNNTWDVGQEFVRVQNVELVIIGFNHDDLTTPISGPTKTFTKAALTVNQKDCLCNMGITQKTSYDDAFGFMDPSDTTEGGWTSCMRRKWCNGGYYKAVPTILRELIKPVNKLTSAGNGSSIINTDSDYVFLLSEIEVTGEATCSYSGEGSQYAYFTKATENRYKLPKTDSIVSAQWWLRSPYNHNHTEFCLIYYMGYMSSMEPSYAAVGISPAFCL